jgi:hypothetical protein
VILFCMPVLFASPIISILIENHDIVIYLSVIYVFIGLLLLGTRRVGSRWTTWYQRIFIIDDKTLKTWYQNHPSTNLTGVSEPSSETLLLRNARELLHQEVNNAKSRKLFSIFRKIQDPMVAKLARSFESTGFLMVG